MAQITFYVSDELQLKIARAAKTKKVSQSKFISDVLSQNLEETWPDEVVALFGSWKDDPIERPSQGDLGTDIKREKL